MSHLFRRGGGHVHTVAAWLAVFTRRLADLNTAPDQVYSTDASEWRASGEDVFSFVPPFSFSAFTNYHSLRPCKTTLSGMVTFNTAFLPAPPLLTRMPLWAYLGRAFLITFQWADSSNLLCHSFLLCSVWPIKFPVTPDYKPGVKK